MQRIIPAHAGFTARVIATAGFRGDHPRTRGVYLDDATELIDAEGSSPHTRGLQAAAAHRGDDVRIIPARAGFTGGGLVGHLVGQDHPRTRGVY